jgi:hypothetical protein
MKAGEATAVPADVHYASVAVPVAEREIVEVTMPDVESTREKFVPVTRFALLDRLAAAKAWAPGEAQEVRRFFRYLDYWRQQQYNARLLDLEQTYEPFSPDTDLLMTRSFSADERAILQKRVVDGVRAILEQANYKRIAPDDVSLIMTRDSHYGLDLQVDMHAFEEILIYYRGASSKKETRRRLEKFGRKEEFDVPIFQRLFILFKLKPIKSRIAEIMAKENVTEGEAERIAKKLRALLPPQVAEQNIYIKLFKNIPRTDLEMIFPNTAIKFRLADKIKLGASAGGGLGMGVVGAAGKIAMLASNPLAAAGAVAGLGGIAFRQAMNFVNQKQRYMVVMAKNLYFHSMADNRGVILKLAARAAEEDVKEEMLLYSVLAREPATRADIPAIDKAIESWLAKTFGITVNFDVEDALSRLMADGIVREEPDGRLVALSPREAALHIDGMWDGFLDNLPDPVSAEGMELDAGASSSTGRIAGTEQDTQA